MRSWLRSPTLLKLFVGQHIVNGLSVAFCVAVVTLGASAIFGFGAGQPATLGAIAASISDFPAPLRRKARLIAVGFSFAIASTLAIQIAQSSPWTVIPVIALVSFIAGLVTGYGRWALALSMQMLIPLVFVLGLPPTDLHGALHNEALLIGGGLAYIAIALGLTVVTDAGGRRLMTSESVREFADYLRAVARFYDEDIDWPEAYGAAIRQQAALSEQMQSARALLLDRPKASNMRLRLAAMIGILLDCFDSLIAAHTELEQLRNAPAAATLRARIAITLRAGALDLQHLSLDLLTTQTPHLPPDHSLAVDSLRREAARLAEHGELSAEESRAVAQTTERIAAALGHVRRLEQALGDDEVARAAIADIDLGAFAARPSYNPRLLLVHLTPNSPVLRFAVRLALAMSAGALATGSLSSVSHGNWVLLTIAVILRPGYGLTAQRRDDRVIGTLIGCVLAALIVALAPIWLLVVVQGLALAVTHGFVRLRYRVASVGASIVALVSLHLINPGEAAPILTRLADTILGAALAQAFSLVLPRWEFNEAPRLASRLQAQIVDFAKVALSQSAGDQEYRLARKSMIEAIAALSDSAGRMGGEPQSMHRGLDEMTKMLIAAYRLCANISALRSGFRAGRHEEIDRTSPELLTGARDLLVKALGDGTDMKTPAGSALASQPPGDLTRWELANLALATDAFVAAASTYRRASKQR
jgi:uncharacterized membrane protein YccC